jgi:hypothetical protein
MFSFLLTNVQGRVCAVSVCMGREGGWGRWGSRANPSTERGVFDFGWKFLALSPSETAAATSRTKRGTTGSGHPNGERQQLRRVVRRAAGGAVTPRADGRRASGVTGQRWQLQQRGANHTTRELAQEEAQWRLHLVAAPLLPARAHPQRHRQSHGQVATRQLAQPLLAGVLRCV